MITLEQKNHYMKHQVAILGAILEKYKPSDECVKCGTDNPLFTDTCKYVGLRHELLELKNTLRNMILYNEYIIKTEKEKKI